MATETTGITRRDLLKRGALVGGAVLWATPVVQVVGMGRAYAKDVSPNCTRFCLKWNVDANAATGGGTCTDNGNLSQPIWSNTWEALGNGEGNSLTCPDGVNNDSDAQDFTNRPGNPFVVYGAPGDGFWIAFPDDVKLADLEDQSEPWSAAVKCGQNADTFTMSDLLPLEDDPCYPIDPDDPPYRRILIPACVLGQDISHIELIVDWCP
jgi:hypothetical protein